MKSKREHIYEKYHGHCAYCGKVITMKEMQIDHVIPKIGFLRTVANKYRIPEFLKHLTVSDLDHIDNLFPSCRRCNFYKGGGDIELYRERMRTIRSRIEKPFIVKVAGDYGLIEWKEWSGLFYFESLAGEVEKLEKPNQ